MICNILDNTTELYMIKYTFGEIVSSRGETLYKNPSDQTVYVLYRVQCLPEFQRVGNPIVRKQKTQ